MHMTTMQKENRQEDDDDDDGVDYRHRRRLYDERPRQSKLTLGQLLSNMDPSAAAVLWDSLVDLVVKTVLVAQPHLYQSYRLCRVGKSVAAGGTSTKERSVCFEILGFDVIIDRSLRPFLLEVQCRLFETFTNVKLFDTSYMHALNMMLLSCVRWFSSAELRTIRQVILAYSDYVDCRKLPKIH